MYRTHSDIFLGKMYPWMSAEIYYILQYPLTSRMKKKEVRLFAPRKQESSYFVLSNIDTATQKRLDQFQRGMLEKPQHNSLSPAV